MVRKIFLILILIVPVAVLTSFTPKQEPVLRTIVIDAGHGRMSNGQHNGAKGSYSYEDEICLDISKKLVKALREQHPNVRIVETRPQESIVDLRERANIANRERGDLFISIHVNAMPPVAKRTRAGYRTQVYYTGKGKSRKRHTRKVPRYRTTYTPNTWTKGTETYIWGSHKADDKELAVRENAPMLAENDYKDKYGELDPNSPEFIALALAKTKQFTMRSATIAGLVEDEFEKAGRISGGKKQRQVGIWVLQATAMPSILVETGFITNPEEEKYLNSETGQNQITGCITAAVKNYIEWLEKKQLPVNARRGTKPKAITYRQSEAMLKAMEAHETGR